MEYFHLTTPQQNIWNLQKYYKGTAIANLCGAVFFQEKRDEALLCRAICRFIRSQSGIRLRFHEGEEPGQYVSEEVNEDIPVRTFRTREEFDAYAETCAKDPIGLSERQMYRFVVFHLEQENRSGILAVLSHLISDAWTFGLMANQLDAEYRRLAGEGDVILLEGDYADFIRSEDTYLASGRYEKDKSYWEGKYPVRPEESPVKLRSVSADSVEAGRVTRTLPPSLEQGIAAYCKSHSVTEAVLFETALIIYLSRINPDIQTVTVGVPVLNRSNAREKEIAGMFVSTMPLTVAVAGDTEIAELAAQITKGHMDLFRHQKYPYAGILRQLREKQDFSGNLYDVMVSYQNAKTKTGADTKWYSNGCSEVPLLVHIDNRDGKECHTINVDYQAAVFRDGTEVELLIERLEYILEQIVAEAAEKVGDIGIVPKREYDRIVYEFNDTHVEYPREKCIHELFMEQADKTPERTALVFEDKKFTYKQLDEMSNSLAHFLREKGIQPGDVVPIIAKRSWHVVVAMLGVLKAGGAYMPVAPNYPMERIKDVVIGAGAKLVLYYQFCGETGIEMYDVSTIDYSYHIDTLENRNSSTDLCYVIYTSGSTGKPKGICQTHKCLSNLINWQEKETTAIGCNILSSTIITFDVSLQEIMYSLLNGGCLYFTNDDVKMNISKYLHYIDENKIDTLFTTPSYFNMLVKMGVAKKLEGVRRIFFAGEKLEIDKKVFEQYVQKTVIQNQYGPAETHVATSKKVDNFSDITIGTPIANTQIYILDSDQRPVPIGVPGELCIAGEGVGKGYLNRPELTAERFVPNPFAAAENHHGKTMYRTGDLARFRSDGEIEYLGRMDTQVKIRGLRIELGEIESVMGSFPGVGLCAVADRRDETGRQYLVGYYTVAAETPSGLDEKALRLHLSAKLPKYMVPNYFMRLDVMPMTASGKTDRKSLPVPDFSQQTSEYAPPETDAEKKLAEIWQELLQVERVGRTDDFFELGGDSLLAISMLTEIEKGFRVELSVREIMEHSELAALARCLEDARGLVCLDTASGGMVEGTAVGRIIARHADRYPLLPQQKAVYAACMKEPGTLVYNMPAKIILPNAIDRDRLKGSIARVLDRHKLLKSCIRMDEAGLYGVYDGDAQIVFEEYKTGKEDAFVRPFDLGKAPLVRVGFTEDALLFDMHHIIADGASMNILLGEITAVYEGGALPQAEAEYSDYAVYFYGLDTKEHKAYFQEALKCGWEPVTLPETKNPGKGGESRLYKIPEGVFSGARKYARENGLTDTMVFLGTYGVLLSKYTGRKEILSSIILQNRTYADTRDMVGMFVNTLPFCLALGNCAGTGDSVTGYMRDVKEKLLGLFRYQELPFEEISEAVRMNDRSVINTSFVYQGDGEKTLSLDGQELAPLFMDTHTAKFDLSMELTPTGNDCRLRLEYNLAKYDGQLMDALVEGYIRILGQLGKKRLADISVLSAEEYHRIVEGFNDTYVEYPREKCIHELFTEQVYKTPERTALVFEDKEFTYRQLDEMSNSLAHFLREKGIQRGDVVPIIARRSWHVIAAMLGVLKAGGAYMPVDPNYPEDRIEYMLSETQAKIVLVCGYTNNGTYEVVDLAEVDYGKHTVQIENHNSSDDICYVLYTSGSAGRPKAVCISHTNMANFISNNINNHYQHAMLGTCSTVLADTEFIFDISAFEIFLSLLNGLCLILTKEIMDAQYLAGLIEKYYVDALHITPTKLLTLLHDRAFQKATAQIKVLMVGAEVFTENLYQTVSRYTDAAIYNGYGPTETTIGASFKKVNGSDITIGTPIANTQIYILDSDQHPVPIGVPGELCIAGEGVGKGYLNRPELTAERFVPNPFATAENHHGKTMYRTGDLARFRSDGEIEYLGRMDTQVKIRGLRIELGEIESVMGSFPGVGLCAVADKRDEMGRQYLVGYYTVATETPSDLDEKALRGHLSAKLPKYMVPNYFMRLETMLMTASGKTDRKSLPEPDFSQQKREYVPPVTEKEKELCRLMEELLHVEQVGVTDGFFELGGDSLTAIEFVAKAHDRGIVFSLQNIFDFSAVGQLCEHMEAGDEAKIRYEPGDFDKYQGLLAENVIDGAFIPERKSLGNVLLTGATGFLGAHVLDGLMREEAGKVYCLVRDGEGGSGGKRLQEILRYYFGDRYEAEFARRIIPVSGDIEAETLSKNMPGDVRTVIHTAASVKHYGSYEYFNRVNVEGTRHVVNYAKSVGARLIHISTLSVSGNSLADEFAVYRSEEEKFFGETSLYIGQPLDNVYVHSKFEAERAVLDAMLTGLDAKIIRVGNLTSRASDYKFQPNYRQNAFLTRFKAILEFGLFPDYLMSLYSEFSPIDLTAEGIVKIAQYADRQTVFHLNSNRPIYFDRFLEVVRELGISMKVVDSDSFNRALRETIRDRVTEYIFEAFQNDMDAQGRLLYDSNIHIENDFTVWFLKRLGFEWNEIDLEYIQGYVEYFREIGYLEI